MNLLEELTQNPFLLAPMAGITDPSFRGYMREMGCGILTTELVSATGLKHKSLRTQQIMAFDKKQHPVGIQIFGQDLDDLAYAAGFVEDMGADFVDLNFGCPVPKVVKKGAGAAVLKDLIFLKSILRKVKQATCLPVTIKVRTGWSEENKNAIEVAQVAYDEGITWMSIHGRTRAQGYSGKSDWDYIKRVKQNSSIPIIGNGDMVCASQIIRQLKISGCDGIMIGRGCLKDPWLFQKTYQLWKDKEAQKISKSFSSVFERLRFYLETFMPERLVLLQTKKIASWYSSGYPCSSEFRKKIFQIKSVSELYRQVFDFFHQVENLSQEDTSQEPFLMGGHG